VLVFRQDWCTDPEDAGQLRLVCSLPVRHGRPTSLSQCV
jgi:hypothetical protein